MTAQSEKPSWKRFSKLSFSKKTFGSSVKKIEKVTIRHAKRFVSSRLDRLSSVKRSVFGWAVLILVLVGVSTFQWVVFRNSYTTSAANVGGTYSEGVLGPLETLNPIFARSSAEKSAARLLFASLYNYDTTGNLKGDLAESISVNDAQTEYTVKLLPKTKWSDGAPLTAKDVVFTVDLMKNPTTRSEIQGWHSFNAQEVDAQTVKFTLPSPYAPFMHSLTFPILPQHSLAGVKPAELREQPFSQSPVTSGPFALRMLQDASPDGSKKIAHMVANPRYRHGAPRLERFQLNIYTSSDDIIKALKTNEIMATPEVVYASLPESIQQSYQSRSYAFHDGVYAIFNTRSDILKSANVRKAFWMSVDRAELRKKLSRSTAELDGPVLADQIIGKLPETPKYDVKKAKSLLDEEGWVVSGDVRRKDGKDLTVKVVALRGADFTQTTEELAKVWRDSLNVRVDVQIVDPLDPSQSVIQAILQPRNFDILVYEFVLGGDPDTYAYWHSSQASPSGLNFANYTNATVDDALTGARSKRDDKYRSDRYQAFVRRWLADVPALPLYQPKLDYIQSRSASSMEDGSRLVFPEDRYANVLYWSTGKTSVYKTP